MPERLPMRAKERVLGIVGDRVVLVRPKDAGSVIAIRSFSTGKAVVDAVEVPELREPYAVVAGSFVIAVPTRLPEGRVGGVTAISTVDGSIRSLIPETASSKQDPVRSLIASSLGDEIATGVCATAVDFTGDCGPLAIVNVSTGATVDSIDIGGGVPVELNADGILAYWLDHVEFIDRAGHLAWKTRSWSGGEFLQFVERLPDGGLVVGVLRTGDNLVWRFLEVDEATGGTDFVAKWTAGPPNFAAILAPRKMVMIEADDPGSSCWYVACSAADHPVLDGAILNLATGEITPHAVHVNLTP